MDRELYVCAISFKDEPNVIHIAKFMMDIRGVPLSIDVSHPRIKRIVRVVFRGVSAKDKKVYIYTEGSKEGEILGG